jgi:hypothetical protein
MTRRALFILLLLLLMLASLPSHAHKPSDSYLTLDVGDRVIAVQWDIALRDLDFTIGVDGDGDGEITWGEVRARHGDIAAYALSRLGLSSAGALCAPGKTALLVDDHTDGAYAVLRFDAACAARIDAVDVRYGLLFDVDPQHKGLLKLVDGGHASTAIFSADARERRIERGADDRLRQFTDYIRHGVLHIWIGFDHILFLLSLLLPAVLVFRRPRWQPSPSFHASLVDVLKIVTAFTLSHSLTLTLATLGVVSLPSRWVESAIAASVAVAALNNLFPLFQGRRWIAAFGFGLIHGFGFASVLGDLGLPRSSLLLALVGFNVGVELGQIAIVAAFLPLAYTLRQTWLYRRLVFAGGSTAILAIAALWLVERMFDLKMISA